LKPDQTDQDSLPPYEVLDAIVEAYMEKDLSPREIIARGFAEADVRRVVHLLKISEYKRRQARRHPGDAARLRQGLALSDHQSLPRPVLIA
jgi:NH3-dependent NAD+ synthetase